MRHLLFDADMTLWDFEKTEEISMEILLTHRGIPFDEHSKDVYKVGNTWCWKQFEKGEMTLETLEPTRWKLFFEGMGLDFDEKEAAEEFGDLLAHNGLLLPGAREFLEAVKDREMSMVTNGIGRIQRQRLKDTDTEKYFSHIFISQEMGPNKPQKAFFDIVLNTLGLSKDQVLMIGDSENSDIRGAINAGIENIYINFKGKTSALADHSVGSYGELEALLKEIG